MGITVEFTGGANRRHKPSPLLLAGVAIDRMTMEQSISWIADKLERSKVSIGPTRPLLVMGPNAHIVTLAQHSAALKSALSAADLCLPDGISVVLAGRILDQPIPERVTGGDFMEQLCRYAAKSRLSVFFLGGLPGAAEGAARALVQRYPGLHVAGCSCPPFGFEQDPVTVKLVLDRICASSPDILCVALGVPKQEIWMHEHCTLLPIRLAIAVGAALDTQAGLRHRAPRWTHRIGLEWAYRLGREPRRLWRRYLLGNCEFLLLVLRARLRQLSSARREQDHASPNGLATSEK
jgi:N-acetylglucosaminyldiphosphoundecaprenol N-acetyl-beta-D-mannosaminyltransferase